MSARLGVEPTNQPAWGPGDLRLKLMEGLEKTGTFEHIKSLYT